MAGGKQGKPERNHYYLRMYRKIRGGGKCTSASLVGVVGSEGMLVPSLANAITQHSDFIDLLRKATKVAAIDTISKTIKNEKLA